VVDVAALDHRADHDRGDARARAQAIAPARAGGRRHVVPVAAVLVVREHDQHVVPLRARAQLRQQVGHVLVAALHVGVRRVLGVAAGGLVEHDRGQRAGGDVAQQVVAVLQVLGAVLRARRVARVVVERLVVRLEVRAALVARVDHAPLRAGRLAPIGERRVPSARVPGPGHALGAQRVADRALRLRRHRQAEAGRALRVGAVERAAVGGRYAARLVGRLRRVDRQAVGGHLPAAAAHHLHGRDVGRGRAGPPGELAVGVQFGAHAVGGVGVARRAGAHEVLVVQVRATERAHEEAVGQRVLPGPLPQLEA
jgi:hypothetical protein